MHPSESILRRSLDEPAAVDAESRQHLASCARCAEQIRRMDADAAIARALFEPQPAAVDVPAARARLARTEAAGAENGAVRQRPRTPAGWNSLTRRVAGAAAVAGVASALLVVTGGAQDFLSLFQPKQFAAVPVTATDVRALTGLTKYGTVAGGAPLTIQPEPDAASAGKAAGLAAPVIGRPPAGISGNPHYAVISGGVVAFSFNADLARAAAARAGGVLPPIPTGLIGSTLSVSIAPSVLISYGLDPATALQGGGLPSNGVVVVVATRTPTVSLTGVTVRELEDYLLSVPGIPASVAAEIRAIGDPSQTVPIPIPVSAASSMVVTINGAHGLLIGDSTGIGSVVLWQHNGIVDAVAGTLSSDQILALARSMH